MSIATNCMVVNLTVGVWQGYRLDKGASQKVTTDAGADGDAARVNKHLVPKECLKDIMTHAGLVRAHFYTKTLPWKDNGDRLLTRKLYQKFVEEHSELKTQFNAAVKDFLTRTYPTVRARSEFRMGTLFNPDDYPDVSALWSRFYVTLSLDAVTEANDFRCAIDQQEAAAVKAGIEQATKARISKAMEDVWARLAATVGHFAAKMNSDEVFRDTTVTNLTELLDLLPGLNLLDDPEMDRIHQELTTALTGVTATDLRKNLTVRDAAAAETARIVDEMKGFMKAFTPAA